MEIINPYLFDILKNKKFRNNLIFLFFAILFKLFVVEIFENLLSLTIPSLVIDIVLFLLFYQVFSKIGNIFVEKNPIKQSFVILYINIFYLSILFFTKYSKIYIFTNLIIVFATIIVLTINLTVLHQLYFAKQKNDISKYFNLMYIFLLVTSIIKTVSTKYSNLLPNFELIIKFLEIVTYLIILYCTTKFAWITFLYKKEKIFLLFLSIFIIVITGINSYILEKFNLIGSELLVSISDFIDFYLIIYYLLIFLATLFTLPSADIIEEKKRELQTLIKFSHLSSNSFSLKEVLSNVNNIFSGFFTVNGCWIIKYDLTDSDFEILNKENISYELAEKLSFYVVTNTIQNDFYYLKIHEEKFSADNKKIEQINVLPLYQKQKEYYLLIFISHRLRYDEEDLTVLKAFKDYIRTVIDNVNLLNDAIEKERIKKELELARDIQNKLLPDKIPNFPQLEIVTYYKPAYEVGGDYYDFFKSNDKSFSVVISDVSGKGLKASFITSEIKGIFTVLSEIYNSPQKIIIKANQIIKNIIAKNSFITASYLTFDFNNKLLRFVRAGHLPLYIIRNNQIIKLQPKGVGLGILSNNFEKFIEELEYNILENDIFVLITDGVSEAQNINKELYGFENLEKILVSSSNITEILNKIVDELAKFSNGNQSDDITIILLKFNSEGKND